MLLKPFDYYSPSSLEEARRLFLSGDESAYMAGGTDLLVKLRGKKEHRDRVIDLKKIPGLNNIEFRNSASGEDWGFDEVCSEGFIRIGSLSDYTAIKENPQVQKYLPALYQACYEFGCYEIRNRATLGGNLVNAAPGSEGGGIVLIYNAYARIFGKEGFKTFPFSQFFTGVGRTVMEKGDILSDIIFPLPHHDSLSGYRRSARVKGQDVMTCGIALLIENPHEDQKRKFRIALSAVKSVPFRDQKAEEMLSGKRLTPSLMEEVKEHFRQTLSPRASSLRGTPLFKKESIGAMLESLLTDFSLL